MSKLLYMGAAGVALAWLATQSDTQTTSNNSTSTDTSANTLNLPPTHFIPMSGTEGKNIELSLESQPNYQTWKRAEWATLWALLVQKYGADEAKTRIWELWNRESNPLRSYIPSRDALFFEVTTWKPSTMAGIGQLAPIEWNSTPVYDTFNNDWHGVDTWDCSHWKVWHQKLEAHYNSTLQANQIWEPAWNHEDNSCWVLGSFGCPKTSNCRYDCDFVKYLKSKELPIGNLVSNTSCDLTGVVSNLVGTASNIASGLYNSSSVAATLVPIGLAALGSWWIVKKLKEE